MKNKLIKNREKTSEDLVAEILSNFTYGSIIPYNYVEDFLTYDRFSYDYMACLVLAKERLVEYGYVLVTEFNEGYRILKPNEIADHVIRKQLLSSLGKLEKGKKILHYANRYDLTDSEKETFDALEKFVTTLHSDNQNKILNASFMLNKARVEELNKGV